MNVLEIGGSGFVGRLINPLLCEHHYVRVFDRVPPEEPGLEFVEGSVLSSEQLAAAMEGMEAIIYLAMGKRSDNPDRDIANNYDVNVHGVHRALEAAANAGIQRAVYASTLSIYAGSYPVRVLPTEEVPGNSREIYGFTKRLGEEVCEFFSRSRGLSCIALRLNAPSTQERWLSCAHIPSSGVTSAYDLGRAFDAALTCENEGFTPVFITGDYTEQVCGLTRAREVLGWEPSVPPTSGNNGNGKSAPMTVAATTA